MTVFDETVFIFLPLWAVVWLGAVIYVVTGWKPWAWLRRKRDR